MEGTTTEAAVTLRRPWHAGLQPMHWRVLIASFLGWIFDGFESFALFLVLPAMLKTLLTPGQLAAAPIWAGIAIAGTLFGWGIGGLVGGVLADYVGRKRIMLWSVFLYAAFSGLTAFATGIWSLLILRCVTGMAMGSEWGTGVSLIAETWPDRARAIGCGFLQSGFGWGTLLAVLVWMLLDAWSPLGPETWRLMFVVGAVPALFVLYIRRNIDESKKWLAAVRDQRWQATEGGTVRHAERPFPLSEIFREPQSRKLVLLTLMLSLAATISWWAVANLLDRHAANLATAAGYPHPLRWGTWASLVYTVGGTAGFATSRLHRERHRPAGLYNFRLRRLPHHGSDHLFMAALAGSRGGVRVSERLLHHGRDLRLDADLLARVVYCERTGDLDRLYLQRDTAGRLFLSDPSRQHDPIPRRNSTHGGHTRTVLCPGFGHSLVPAGNRRTPLAGMTVRS